MITSDDIRKIVSDTTIGIDLKSLGDDDDFKKIGIDSLDHINILLVVEEKYGTKIPDEMVDQCDSINEIIKYLTK